MIRERLTWFCTICHRERPDERISVYTRDSSERLGFPPGTVRENIRYCNDSALCRDVAEFYSHFGPMEEPCQSEAAARKSPNS